MNPVTRYSFPRGDIEVQSVSSGAGLILKPAGNALWLRVREGARFGSLAVYPENSPERVVAASSDDRVTFISESEVPPESARPIQNILDDARACIEKALGPSKPEPLPPLGPKEVNFIPQDRVVAVTRNPRHHGILIFTERGHIFEAQTKADGDIYGITRITAKVPV